MLHLTNLDNYFVFHSHLGLVTLFYNLFVSVLKINSLFISFISTEYTGIFFIDELTSISIHLDSLLTGFLLVFWLIRLIIVEET